MKLIRSILTIIAGLGLSANLLYSQTTDFANVQLNWEAATDTQAMLAALATTEPVPFADLPKNRLNRVSSVGFWSMQKPTMPPLPGNIFNLDVWPLGDGHFVLDDRNMDYVALQAAAELAAKLDAAATLKTPRTVMRMMSSSLASYGNPVYLTNLVVTTSPIIASFDIAGGTNNVPYDIQMSTNLAAANWNWLGIGYTSNRYNFSSQPSDLAFYRLAKPSQTLTIAWGQNGSGQSTVPTGLTNAVMVAGGIVHSVALLVNSNLVAWGDNTYGQTNIPAGLTNAVLITANSYHNLALRTDGTVASWGAWLTESNSATTVSVPSGLTNVVALAAGLNHDLVVQSNGAVIAWGFTATNPYVVVPSNLPPALDVAAGESHSVALLTNGTVVAWGYNYASLGWDVTNVPAGLSNVVAIAAGDFHTLALKADGTVVAWGAGDGFTFADLDQSTVPAGLSNVVAIAASGYHSMALKKDGTVVTWGDLDLPNFPLNQLIGLGCGWNHALVIRTGNSTPLIIGQPASQLASPGQTVTFSVQAIGLAALQYQWQFNNVTITNATNSTLVLTNVTPQQQGYYRALVSGGGSVMSSNAVLRMLPPLATDLPVAGLHWIQGNVTLSVPPSYLTNLTSSLQFQWSHNGAAVAGAIYTNFGVWFLPAEATNWEGNYSVSVTGSSGTTNLGTWSIYYLWAGGIAAWGEDDFGQTERPAGLTNIAALAAGEFHSVAATENGAVLQWGFNWGDVPTDLTNTIAVAAGYEHSLALRKNGTVVAWGTNDAIANYVPSGLAGVKAVACGWNHNVALLTNGTVTAWGYNGAAFGWNLTNVPPGLSNVTAIAASGLHSVALRRDGTVVSWGNNADGETNVPAGLTNVVAIAAGGEHSLALKSDGTVTAWGFNGSGQCGVPVGLSNVMAIAAGWQHSVALKNDGTLVSWGSNSDGQTNIVSGLNRVKLLAAGGNHNLVGLFSPTVQYPIDVTKDLLLIYNTNSTDSKTVLDYYLAHRPMVGGANVLGIGYTNAAQPGYYEIIDPVTFTNNILSTVQTWLANNPSKRPQYVVLFPDVPSIVFTNTLTGAYAWLFSPPVTKYPSVQCLFNFGEVYADWNPFVTSINMNGYGGTNDCIAYINKLENIGTNYSLGKLVISPSDGGYSNTNYLVDNVRTLDPTRYDVSLVSNAVTGLIAAGVQTNSIFYLDGWENGITLPHLTNMANVAGYITWGAYTSLGGDYPINGKVKWSGDSGWWLMRTEESFNGERLSFGQGIFVKWYASNAFGGTNYSNTPIGGATYTDEPRADATDNAIYFGLWASGKNLAICSWAARNTILPRFVQHLQVVGDPFVTK